MTTDLDRAFARLDTFFSQRFPRQIRLLRCRTSLHPGRHADIIDDLRQSLALDCSEHPETITSLDEASLWQRWHRLVQREHYAIRGRQVASLEGAPPPLAHESRTAQLETLSKHQQELLNTVQDQCVLLKNGRVSLGATAQRLGIHPRALRDLWSSLTEELGLGEAHTHFWCNRLAEALLDSVEAALASTEPPEPASTCESPWQTFRQRFRRIRRALAVRQQPIPIRDALLQLSPRRARTQPPTEQLLLTAEQVAPKHPRLAPIRARVRRQAQHAKQANHTRKGTSTASLGTGHRLDTASMARNRVSMRLRSSYSHCE